MTLDFKPFKAAIAKQFQRMQGHTLYRTSATRDDLWEVYLGSFPPGTDPMLRQRTEHDCSACRGFVKTLGGCVAIIDGKVETLWDVTLDQAGYQAVADALAEFVRAHPIDNLFLHAEPRVGVDRNLEQLASGQPQAWEHLSVNLPRGAVAKADAQGVLLAAARSTHDVMLRSLQEITAESVSTVLDLISQNSIYRGEENKWAVTEFEKLKRAFDALTTEPDRDLFVWLHMTGLPESVGRIRNTAIGTLLTDLSEGVDLESAVKSFESKVAPQNYKRPTALVTKAMIEGAQAKITELGLMSALGRRYARLEDVTVNNVLHANRSAKRQMGGNVFDDLAASVAEKPRNFDKVEEVPVDKFVADVVPRAESIEVLFENRLAPNLVSLIAPEDPTAGQLFKWGNGFSWDYAGGFADSIKERVKKAGGSVEGDLCCRLAWHNTDDLDLSMLEPSRFVIYYGRKVSPYTKGQLDVDMNVIAPVRDAVENIYYGRRQDMQEGTYALRVHNFRLRESADVGFEVELDYLGEVRRFVYEKGLRHGEMVTVAEFTYTHAGGLKITQSLPSTEVTRTVWGLPTQTFQRVSTLMLSPNHWDGQGVGNRHLFFMLDGARREEPARGFYNEFLKNELDPHRRAFELVGARMRPDEDPRQLSGVGFSTTQRNHVIVRVAGATTRTIKVTF